ncbi:MAG: NAD(P)/FAD-dependent oxidoreductase [Methylobacillus sp.]|jgi:NADPH-dependent 2,4-dienoyl-CoA reductase/sulfur reductase-like enzyme|nr:NAD(P)/FAD-dependent oxidoreductase [Methylobacillus sp.]
MQRREFLKLMSAAIAAGMLPTTVKAGQARGRVVIVGGGYAGATAAKYLRLWGGEKLEISLVEESHTFISCPLSNLVLGGSKKIGELTFGRNGLDHYGIRRYEHTASFINPEQRIVMLTKAGTSLMMPLQYDRLIIAPGIDFVWDRYPALRDAAGNPLTPLRDAEHFGESPQPRIPHAWKAGAQTVALRRQLEAMPDGGTFVMSVPKMPYRCPPGPYERASQVAFYFSRHKPKSKVIVLDENPDIVSKKALFLRAWNELYPGMIDYRPNNVVTEIRENGGQDGFRVKTEFDELSADVLNVIPPQCAGDLAQGMDNVDGWCEVDFMTYESKVVPGVHIIGDAVSSALPKSAHMASSQAKVAAAAIVALLSDAPPDPQPVFANTCYSFVSDKLAMHVANVYRYDAQKKIMLPAEGGGVSDRASEQESDYAQWWAKNIWSDVLT